MTRILIGSVCVFLISMLCLNVVDAVFEISPDASRNLWAGR